MYDILYQAIYQCNITAGMAVKRLDAEFLQVTTSAGPDRIMLGMKFRSAVDTTNFTALLEQCTASGDPRDSYIRA